MQKKLFISFCFMMYFVNLFSQNTISGKITNQENQVLEGSHIHIGTKTVSSKTDGIYIVRNLTNGKTTIHVSFIGYTPIDTVVVLKSNLELNFVLKQSDARLSEVVVNLTKNMQNKSVLEQKIKIETIEKYSNLSLGDALKEITGVATLKTGSTVVKPIINGLYGSRIPVINNNVRLEDQEWGTEHAPNFDLNSAGKITVIKGASGLQFGGDAVGGLVIIESISVKKDTLFGKTLLNLTSNGRGGSVSTSIHKGNVLGWSWNALGTFKYLGDKETPNDVLSNSGNREANFTGDLKFTGKKYAVSGFYSYYNTTIGILSASHTGNVNDLYNSINNKVPSIIDDFTYSIQNPKQEVQHHIAKMNFNYYFDETASLSFQYAFQFNKRLEFDVRRGNYNNVAALDLSLKTHSFNLDYKKSNHDWTVKSGMNTSFQNNFANPATGIRPLIPNYDKIDLGVYGVVSHDLSESFSLETGLRYDYTAMNATKYYIKSRWDKKGYDSQFAPFIKGESGNQWLTKPSFKFHNASASLGFFKKFTNYWNWYTNISLATRNPNPSEFFSDGLHHSTGVIELGDLSLEKEQSVKLSTTFTKKWNGFSVEINPYINRISNYMFLSPTDFETTIRGSFPVWEYQKTNAQIAGIDFETCWYMVNNWDCWFSFAYVYGKDNTKNKPLIDMPPFTFTNKIQYSKKEWNNLVLEIKSEFVANQSQFPNNNFFTKIIVDGVQELVLVDISTPPPAYGLMHFYSEMKFKTFYKTNTTLAFSVQNIMNTKYRDYLNRQRFFVDETGRNFQLQLRINY
jgi:iron complex outermembrane recepter protein